MQLLGKTFVKGIATVLPVALTLYVLWWLGTSAEAAGGWLLRRILGAETYRPGTGLLLGLGLVFAVGLLMNALIARRLVAFFEQVLERIPLVKSVYGPLKDLMGFFSGGPGEGGKQAVRVRVAPGLSLLGLQTRDPASAVTRDEGDADNVAVYLPMSYQLGGFMVIAPRAEVERVSLGVEEVLKVTVTAGLSRGEDAAARGSKSG